MDSAEPAATWHRHDWLYVRPDCAFTFMCQAQVPEAAAAVQAWLAAGRPLVMARQAPHPTQVSLALTLPPPPRRQRVAISVPKAQILKSRPPCRVQECRDSLLVETFAVLLELERQLADLGGQMGCYGSLAWEWATQLSYRHETSDIDVICDIHASDHLPAALAALASADQQLGGRLDGEIRLPDQRAVAWRELHKIWNQPQAQLLYKSDVDAGLIELEAWLSMSASRAAPLA